MAWTERGEANRKIYIDYYRRLRVPDPWKRGVLSVTLDDNSADAADSAPPHNGTPERSTSE